MKATFAPSTGRKCNINHPAASKDCSFDSLYSYELTRYSQCGLAKPEDTCDETYVKIGETHDWTAACRQKWSDLPVYKWICLP